MIAGCVVLGAILFSIGASVMKSFPPFARHMREGLRLAGGRYSGWIGRSSSRRARIIPFPAGRAAGR